jgi:hypothetical protein
MGLLTSSIKLGTVVYQTTTYMTSNIPTLPFSHPLQTSRYVKRTRRSRLKAVCTVPVTSSMHNESSKFCSKAGVVVVVVVTTIIIIIIITTTNAAAATTSIIIVAYE